jgi:sec-independent protein translocase protein TatA
MSLGMPEIIALLVIALLVFGPSRLPGLGKSMGEAIRGFKKGMDGAGDKEGEETRESLQASKADSVKSSSKIKQEENS